MVAELKSSVQHVNDILAQLQAGADLLIDSGEGEPFAAVLVHSGRMGTQEIRQLRTRRVHFRGRDVPVRVLKSRASLLEC